MFQRIVERRNIRHGQKETNGCRQRYISGTYNVARVSRRQRRACTGRFCLFIFGFSIHRMATRIIRCPYFFVKTEHFVKLSTNPVVPNRAVEGLMPLLQDCPGWACKTFHPLGKLNDNARWRSVIMPDSSVDYPNRLPLYCTFLFLDNTHSIKLKCIAAFYGFFFAADVTCIRPLFYRTCWPDDRVVVCDINPQLRQQ